MRGGYPFWNGLCRLSYLPAYRKFLKPCDIGRVQREYLFRLLKENADTVYGRLWDFGRISSYEEFAERVPLTVYEDYIPYIDRIAVGEKKVLTSEEVRLFELTSGSSSAKKLIPYTKTLKNEFLRGVKPWLCDIYSRVNGVSEGRSYWSVTPVISSEKSFTEGGIPIGFEEDTEYFGPMGSMLLKKLFAVDSSVKLCSDTEDFYRRTALSLLACGDLTLISVWSPSFLSILCGYMAENGDALCDGLAAGGHGRRSRLIRESLRERQFQRVFSNLKIISCWADGSAADCVREVEELFPGVMIQPKGLLATECFVSFPLVGETGSRLSLYSHFFEFCSLKDGRIYPPDELKPGEYELIVTTGGGFYRYCIGDVVEVLKTFPDAPPLIRFLGRKGAAVDRFGEKLTESFVRKVLGLLGANREFSLLAPRGKGYCLYTKARHVTAGQLEAALCESFHYQYCRKLGQLDGASVALVGGEPSRVYLERLRQKKMRLGDIKPASLSAEDGWEDWFEILEYRE